MKKRKTWVKVIFEDKRGWSCTHCHSFYKKSAATQHYCQRRLVLSLLSFLLQKECCNTTLLPRGQRRLVLSLLSFLLQKGKNWPRKRSPFLKIPRKHKTWVWRIPRVPWTFRIEKTVKVTQQRKFSWSCTHCHSFYKKSAATQHYCQRRLVLSVLSFLLQKECCNTTLLPRGQRRLVLSLLSFLLQNGKNWPRKRSLFLQNPRQQKHGCQKFKKFHGH